MDRKTKINVLLPMKMVGELENYSKIGKRSDFIMKAIRSRLDGDSSFDIDDFSTRQMAIILQNRLLDEVNCEMSEVLGLVLRKWVIK
jgi:metal-responsive CopG/Arc/MetJ family transcriptional regulator|tara:strand:- start:1595 stop:1855 length:261 start_codon:yes stop_codon:yes gene_type:complete